MVAGRLCLCPPGVPWEASTGDLAREWFSATSLHRQVTFSFHFLLLYAKHSSFQLMDGLSLIYLSPFFKRSCEAVLSIPSILYLCQCIAHH